MPSVQFQLDDLETLLGSKVPRDKDGLNRIFAYVKGDVDSYDEANGEVGIEVKDSNHPDIWSVEGIARSLRGYLGKKPAPPPRVSGRSSLKIVVDKGVKQVRPYIAGAIVRGVENSETALKSWIGLQDRLDQTYGRKRKKASIGLYQADLVTSPLRYTVSRPDQTSFTPLGSGEKMTLAEILVKHPKGIEYGPIISPFKEWPLLIDGKGKVLSLPPVINSNDLGRVTNETRNILVEVTGTTSEVVNDTLKIVVTALADRGGKILSCAINYPNSNTRTTVSPDLSPTTKSLSISYTNALLGTTLKSSDVIRLLRRASYAAVPKGKYTVQVIVPCYRLDILHQVDLVEDIAIAMDINTVKPEWPQVWAPGGLTRQTDWYDTLAEIMVGLGFQELLTYSLSSREVMELRMRTPPAPIVDLKNPKVSTLTSLRNWLLPSLMEFLSSNTHVDYPQRVFEIGTCAIPKGANVGDVVDHAKLSSVTIHDTAGFTEIRASLDALLGSIRVDFKVEPATHPSFLDGRCGAITARGKTVGTVGEIHPQVLKAWGLNLPAAAFELDLSHISEN